MRAYLVDELPEGTVRNLVERLASDGCASSVARLFWLPVERELLNDLQREHEKDCGPYRLALELSETSVRLELLARPAETMHCQCIAYLPPESERVMMARLDALLAESGSDDVDNFFSVCC